MAGKKKEPTYTITKSQIDRIDAAWAAIAPPRGAPLPPRGEAFSELYGEQYDEMEDALLALPDTNVRRAREKAARAGK